MADFLKDWGKGGHTKGHLIEPKTQHTPGPWEPKIKMKHFEGYPLCSVQEGNRIVIYTHNAVQGQATVFATTDTPEKALAIVNKVNFFDKVLEALKDCHVRTANEEFRTKLGKIIIKATGGE